MDVFSKLLQLYSDKRLTQAQRNVEMAKIDLAYYEEQQQRIQQEMQDQKQLLEKYRRQPELISNWRVQEGDEWMNSLLQEMQRQEQYIVNARNIIKMGGVQ